MISGLKIAGLDKQSFIDYPGNIATLIFTQGCNFRCFYCHNSELVLPERFISNLIDPETVIYYLKSNKGLIDALVITGGEPTLQPGLIPFIKTVKELGFKVKIDTNGTNFQAISYLIQNHLIDYIAMDIKTAVSVSAYKKIVGNISEPDIQNITRSIKLIKKSGITYEFRTTVVKNFHNKTIIEEIGRVIDGANLWAIQNCLFTNILYPSLKYEIFKVVELEKLANFAKQFVNKVIIRY